MTVGEAPAYTQARFYLFFTFDVCVDYTSVPVGGHAAGGAFLAVPLKLGGAAIEVAAVQRRGATTFITPEN